MSVHVYTCIIAKTHKHDFVTFFLLLLFCLPLSAELGAAVFIDFGFVLIEGLGFVAGLSRNWIRRKALKPPLNFNTMLHYILRGREERNVRPKQKLIMGW